MTDSNPPAAGQQAVAAQAPGQRDWDVDRGWRPLAQARCFNIIPPPSPHRALMRVNRWLYEPSGLRTVSTSPAAAMCAPVPPSTARNWGNSWDISI